MTGDARTAALLEALDIADVEAKDAARSLQAAMERSARAARALHAAQLEADAARYHRVTAYLIADRRRTMELVIVSRGARWVWAREPGATGPAWMFRLKGVRWVGDHWCLTRESVEALPALEGT